MATKMAHSATTEPLADFLIVMATLLYENTMIEE